MPDEVTTGELSRRLDSMERMFDRRFREVREDLQSMQFVGKEAYERDQIARLERDEAVWKAIGDINAKDQRRSAWLATLFLMAIAIPVVLQILQLR